MNGQPATSPVIRKPEPAVETETFDFPEAMRRVIEGKKVSKMEWKDSNFGDYGLLRDGWLMIFRNGSFHRWVISEGDLTGDDFFAIK